MVLSEWLLIPCTNIVEVCWSWVLQHDAECWTFGLRVDDAVCCCCRGVLCKCWVRILCASQTMWRMRRVQSAAQCSWYDVNQTWCDSETRCKSGMMRIRHYVNQRHDVNQSKKCICTAAKNYFEADQNCRYGCQLSWDAWDFVWLFQKWTVWAWCTRLIMLVYPLRCLLNQTASKQALYCARACL